MHGGHSGDEGSEITGELEALLTATRRKNEVRLKGLVTSGIRQVFHRAGINTVVNRLWVDEAIILFYHKVHARPVGCWGESVLDARRFTEHLEYLSREFEPVSLSDVVRARTGGHRLPKRAVAITFDDGYRNNLVLAAPLLRRFRIPATLFVTTGLIGTDRWMWAYELEQLFARHDPMKIALASGEPALARLCARELPRRLTMLACVDYLKNLPHRALLRALDAIRGALHYAPDEDNRFLSWDEVRELRSYGFELGAHTVTHPILPHTLRADLEAEVVTCKRVLEEQLGAAPTLFSYPNGDTNPGVTELVGKHFEAAVTTTPGVCTRSTPLLELPRVGAPVEVADLAFDVTRQLLESNGTDLDGWEPVPRPKHPLFGETD